nr:hypothetical protein [Tanacetum cinerariifolium]
MTCYVPHTYDEIKSMVEKQIQEDRGRQLALMNLGHQCNDAITAKDDLRKAYEECRDIPLEQLASSEGVWCFSYAENSMLLLWNPLIKKSIGILVPNYTFQPDSQKMIFGFGISHVTLEPTLLKINYPLYSDGPCKDKEPIVEAMIVQQCVALSTFIFASKCLQFEYLSFLKVPERCVKGVEGPEK